MHKLVDNDQQQKTDYGERRRRRKDKKGLNKRSGSNSSTQERMGKTPRHERKNKPSKQVLKGRGP